MIHRHYVSIDTETGGLDVGSGVWEVAMIGYDERGLASSSEEFQIRIDPAGVKDGAARVNGFRQRYRLGSALERRDAALRIVRFTTDAILVGSSPWFDRDHLAHLIHGTGYRPSWQHRMRDVPTLVEGHLGRAVGGLADAAASMGLDFPVDEQHTAMGDAKMAFRIHREILLKGA